MSPPIHDGTLRTLDERIHKLEELQHRVVGCEKCPRLRSYCAQIAQTKRRAYRDWDYWGRPVPSFGDPQARVLIVGLAPAAHGANRTGRMFTGDRSGDFLYRVLFDTGFASQPVASSRDDGMELRRAYITAVVRCAPPANKPSRAEIANCRAYLESELDLLADVRVIVALGRVAFDVLLSVFRDRGVIGSRRKFEFGHGAIHQLGAGLPILISAYHPSQQNTLTGRLTYPMMRAVFQQARRLAELDPA